MAKKTLYLVRHGEAEHNLKEPPRLYRGAESELTELGHRQAGYIAERASHLTLDVLITSSMRRARQTAEHIAKRIDKDIVASDLFVEAKDPPSQQGKVWLDPEVQHVHKEWQATLFSDQRVRDGENFPDLRTRAKDARRFLETRDEDSILVVTHGLFLRALVGITVFKEKFDATLFDQMDNGFRTTNTGLTILQYDPKDPYCEWWLLVWNDHAHLAE